MKRWTIYCHTHISTGRRYIGLTSQTMEKRWNQHISQAKNSKDGRWHFPNAVRKYGKEAFTHEVLSMSWDLDGANATEEALIEQYNTRNPDSGFNITKGGLHTPHPIKNPWNRPEYREKQANIDRSYLFTTQARIAHKAALNTSESRAKRSAIFKKINENPEIRKKNSLSHLDKKFSSSHRDKISKNMKAINALKSSEEHKRHLDSIRILAIKTLALRTHDEIEKERLVASNRSKAMSTILYTQTPEAREAHRNKCSKLSISDVDKISIMRSNGCTQLEVAKIFGVHRRTISKFELKTGVRTSGLPIWNKGKRLDSKHKLRISSALSKDYCIRGHDMDQFRGAHGCRACQKIRNAARFSCNRL